MSRNPRSLKGALQRKTKAELIELLLEVGEFDFQTRIYMKERLYIRRDQEADLEGFYDELRSVWPFPGSSLSKSSEKSIAKWFADATGLLRRRAPETMINLAWFALETVARLQPTCVDLEQADRLADLAVAFHVDALRLAPNNVSELTQSLAQIEVDFDCFLARRIEKYSVVLGEEGMRIFERLIQFPENEHEIN